MPARYDYTGLADQPWALATRQLSERRSAGLVLSARRHTQDREGWDPRGGMRVPPTIIAVATGICPSSASSSLTGRGNPPVLRSGGRGMACVHLLDRDRPGSAWSGRGLPMLARSAECRAQGSLGLRSNASGTGTRGNDTSRRVEDGTEETDRCPGAGIPRQEKGSS